MAHIFVVYKILIEYNLRKFFDYATFSYKFIFYKSTKISASADKRTCPSLDIFSDISQKSKFIKLKDASYENFPMFFIRKNVNFIHEKIKNFSWIIK